MNLPRLMIIDDDESILGMVQEIGVACGYEVAALPTPTNVIATLQQFDPAVVILDLAMPEGDGVKLMRRLANAQCSAKVAILSGADTKTLFAAFRLGREYGLEMAPPFSKPFDPESVRTFLQSAKVDLRRIAPDDMLEALTRGQFEVRYQPKVDLKPGSSGVIGAEALLRWHHPSKGLLAANRFISMAEQEGLIEPLSSWVLAQVVSQLKKWECNSRQLVVAVNLPSTLLADLDFPDRVEAMLRHTGVSPQHLMLEITEREAMKDGPTAVDVLTRLRLKGISLSIDDFGVGYSSLLELYRMPFNELKIDASFVRDMPASQEAQTIVRTLITLSHELGLKACAEGVESHDTSRMLQAYGCDSAQGFLYGAAMAPTEFEALLAGHPKLDCRPLPKLAAV